MPTKIAKKKKEKAKDRFIEGIGRRKTSTARVRIYPSTSKPLKEGSITAEITINEKPLEKYFALEKLKQKTIAAFTALSVQMETNAKVEGGGINAQAEAIRLGISRALTALNEKWRPRLRSLGLLTRDPRAVERKHPGLRKARRPQQWRKR